MTHFAAKTTAVSQVLEGSPALHAGAYVPAVRSALTRLLDLGTRMLDGAPSALRVLPEPLAAAA